jgi:ATP-dependent RNA helicase DDX54/DBP10
MAKFTDLRISSIVGGDSIEGQFDSLADNPDIIIATPGRLMHHLRGFIFCLTFYIFC